MKLHSAICYSLQRRNLGGHEAHLADDEDRHDSDEHNRNVILTCLLNVHLFAVGTRSSNGHVKTRINDRQQDQWNDAHDRQVKPREIHRSVSLASHVFGEHVT